MTDGQPLSYEVAGPDSAPAIVFVHGTRLTRSSWRAQVDALHRL